MKQGRVYKPLGAVAFAALISGSAVACDSTPAEPTLDGAVDWAKVCITQPGRLRVDDSYCKETGAPDSAKTGYVYAYAQLPASPTKTSCEVDPEDGVCYSYSYTDVDDGDFNVIALGSFAGNNYYAYPPSGNAGLRSVSGLSTNGGIVTRGASGSAIANSSNSIVGNKSSGRSGTVSRGGLGVKGSSTSSGS